MSIKRFPMLATVSFSVVLMVCGAGCRGPQETEAPSFSGSIEGVNGSNVILITLDTTRADHIGSYGGPEGITPNIDERLAAKGVRFTRTSAVSPITLPAHASMLTGLYPYRHGVRSNGSFALAEEFETLGGSFRSAGYQTAAFISASVLTRRYGLARDFDLYDDDLSKVTQHMGGLVPSRKGNFTIDSTLEWIRARDRKKPFFCWVHIYDPHAPLVPPPDFAARFKGDLYSAEIAFADAQVGRLLNELEIENIANSTYVSVIGDHGEGLGEHGEKSHGILIHQATIHVPWILRGPGIPEGVVVHTPVSNVDTAPTLAALAGVDAPNASSDNGINVLSREALEPEAGGKRGIVIEALLPRYQYGWSPLYGLRRDAWKLVSGTKDELFDLDLDPGETKDCSAEHVELLAALRSDLRPIVESGSEKDSRITLTPGEREQLEALGYLGLNSAERPNAPDPREVIGAHVNLELAMNLLANGRLDEAKRTLDKALSLDPTNVMVLNQRAQVFIQRDQTDDARKDLLQSISLDPNGTDAYQFLSQIELSLENFTKALELARIGAETRGAFEIFTSIEARALIGMGRQRDAQKLINDHLKSNPDDTDLLSEQARMYLVLNNNPREAEKVLRHAMEVDSLSAKVRFQLANLLRSQERNDEAGEVLKSILTTEPGNARALAMLGMMQMGSDPASSIPYLEEAVRMAPEDPAKLTTLGVAYIKANRVPDAESVLRKATGLDPSNPQIRNNLAILLIRQGKLPDAIEQLEVILSEHPTFTPARNNLAIAYLRGGDLEKAESAAREAIAQDPDFLDARMTLASLFNRQERWTDEYEILSTLDPGLRSRKEVVIPLAIAASRTGHCKETIRLLTPMSDRGDRLGWQTQLALGTCSEKVGRSAEALRHFEEAARLSPPGPGRNEAQAGLQRLSIALGRKGH